MLSRRVWLGGTSALSLAAAAASCQGKPTLPANADDAPPFSGKTLDGETFDLQEHKGDVVLVNIWATWCEPCRAELPELARLHREYESRGFLVLGISADVKRLKTQVRNMVEDFELPYPIVHDWKNESVVSFKVNGYPTSFLVDRRGRIVWRRDGMVAKEDRELMGMMEAALAESV